MGGPNPTTFSSAGRSTQHYIPGAYSRSNFVSNEGGGVSSGNICIVGYSELGEPQKLLVFDSANDARGELSSGEGLEGVIQAFTPGNDLIPQQVGFIRINPGTQSSRTLQKSSSDRFTVKSFNYGVPMNQLRLKFSAGTTAGTHKIETEFQGATEETDNIEKKSFTIQYVGAGTAAVMTIDATTLSTTVTGGPGGEDLAITLADYPTISELVEFINNQTAYSASILTSVVTESSEVLDAVTGVDIDTAVYTVKSDYQAVFDALKANTYLIDVAKEGTVRDLPDYDVDFVYLAGGTSGTSTTTDYSDALEVLEQEDVQLISTPSTDIAIHVLIRDHCILMNSEEGKKERQFYVGGALNETVEEVKTRNATLNSAFGSNCSPGYYQFNDAGEETLYAPSYYACKQVGQVSALALNTPTTSKTVNIIRWEKDYKRSEVNDLIKNATLVGGKDDDDQYITVRSLTTFQSGLLQKNEASIQRETLYQDADLRKRLSKALVGSPNLGNDLIATATTVFERAIQDWKGLGIIVAQNGRLYSGLVITVNGDIVNVEYNTWNTAPVNFVFITHNVSVLRTAA
jgi:hypothetical protein